LEIWHLHYKLKQKHYNKETLSRLRHTTCREIHIKEKTHQYLKKKRKERKEKPITWRVKLINLKEKQETIDNKIQSKNEIKRK
jgi:hypothetical protein